MAKFTTPYDTLLRVRRIEEDRAKAALAVANQARRDAQARLESRQDAYGRAAVPTNGETDLVSFRGQVAHLEAAARSVVIAGTDVETADRSRAVAVEATRQASMRTQGLERLVDRAREARMQEMLAADQRTAEESMAGKRPGRPKGAQ